ncbi:hypothetical protein Lepto7375DRAFT_5158 [Leptolyngbya sp. PCC 7375]|nr:hypothetical protein Lepto7375DRAFT_5158 [Leptolyngbya sp. PCC 7375]
MTVLESVHIQNFRCLRDVTLELGSFTVFVGPNASGKSAIAEALTMTSSIHESIPASDYWRREVRPLWSISPNLDKLSDKPNILGGTRSKYVFDLQSLRRPQIANEAWTLSATGINLANLFNTLSRPNQEKFVAEFTLLVPMYSDIKVRAHKGDTRLQFLDRWQEDLWYEPEQVSDGTILTAALIALGFQKKPPTLAVIEDPDRGLHPYLQRHAVEMLRKLSKGELGNEPIQVVCTTHSKAFLDCLEPEEVIFIRRSRETGETQVQKAPTDNPNWNKVYDQFQNSLGSMWLTGTLGGVPGI